MQEHSKREEPLEEELLDRVSGAGSSVSTTRNPGPFLDCRECRSEARQHAGHIIMRDGHQTSVDYMVSHGNNAMAELYNQASNERHQWAQESYQKMEAHGHPDFPAALRQLRQNYNPPL
jgi:hypothetical protein